MDVLKVMQRVIVTLDYTADGDEDSIAYRDKKDLTEARAAVAELIEAAREARDLLAGWENLSRNNVANLAAEACERLNAALDKASP